uniref:Toll-like receptor 4 n=1 Tax=Ditylenchus dipsaci TaxID=166011 RepID=A0A915ERY0_9BILA
MKSSKQLSLLRDKLNPGGVYYLILLGLNRCFVDVAPISKSLSSLIFIAFDIEVCFCLYSRLSATCTTQLRVGIFGSAVDHQKFPNLKSIDLSNLADASFEGLTLFLEESQHLEFLRIIECSSVFHKYNLLSFRLI